jgi:acyl dehydratase
MSTENRYLEDLTPGERLVSEAVVLTEDDITRFGRAYDPQPMHTDPEIAAQGPFGGLIASGWHLAALVMRLSVESRSFGGTPIIGAGADELRWLQPVRPGDALTLERVIEQVEPPVRPGGRGTVRTRMTVRNQRDEKVMTMLAIGKIPVRPS